jgi:hypothetical protein
VLGALAGTTEYGIGVIRATPAASGSRGGVLAAKALMLSSTLIAAGTVTAFVGYFEAIWSGRVSFNPQLLGPWTGFAVFTAEVAAVLLVAYVSFRLRDA